LNRDVDDVETRGLLSGDELLYFKLGDALEVDDADVAWRTSGIEDMELDYGLLCFVRTRGRRLECMREEPTISPADWIPAISNVSDFVIGFDSLCAVQSGRVKCMPDEGGPWVSVPDVSSIIQIVAVLVDVCALDKSGGVTCWRRPGYGPDYPGHYSIDQPPSALGVHDGVAIAAGPGLLVQTARGSLERFSSSAPAAPEIIIERGVVEIAGGGRHGCARVDADGDGVSESIVCLGDNRFGQLGALGDHVSLAPVAISFPDQFPASLP
jgi:hypothetical protein